MKDTNTINSLVNLEEEAEIRHKTILESIPDIIMEVNNDHVYTWANTAGYTFFGRDVLGKKADYYFIDDQKTYEIVKPVFEGTSEVVYVENWQKRVDGEKRLLAWWCKTLRNQQGQVIGALSTARDITEQRLLEESVHSNEKRYKITMERTGQLIYEYFVDTGKIIWNGAIERITGYTEEEFREVDVNKWAEMIHPEDREKSDQELEKANKNIGEYNIEYRFRRKDGQYIYVVDHGVFVTNGKNVALKMYGTMTDISEKKATEQLLVKSEKYLRGTLDSTDDGMLVVGADNEIIILNNRFKEIWEVPDEIVKDGDDALLLKYVTGKVKNPEAFLARVKELYASNRTDFDTLYSTNEKIIERYSTPLIINEENVGRVWSFRDVTERETAKQAAIEENAKNYAILTSIGEALLVCNVEGNIVLFNPIAERLTKTNSSEAIGRKYDQIVSFVNEISNNPNIDLIGKTLTTGNTSKTTEHIMLLRKDGNKIPVTMSVAPVISDKGQFIGCVVVIRDITREYAVDKAKTEFVSLASHELRTPLATINWYCELLSGKDSEELSDLQKNYVQEIYQSNKRMSGLINELLNISRLELNAFMIKPKEVDAVKISKECLKELEPRIVDKKLTVNEIYDAEPIIINADPQILTIIFRNILSNAVRYTPLKGTVTVKVKKDTNYFIINVSDTGIGIPLEQQALIFDKLYRADNARKVDPEGTGLGLYTVKEIIDYAGGTIKFDSIEGKGTNFYITLPLTGMVEKEGTKNLV